VCGLWQNEKLLSKDQYHKFTSKQNISSACFHSGGIIWKTVGKKNWLLLHIWLEIEDEMRKQSHCTNAVEHAHTNSLNANGKLIQIRPHVRNTIARRKRQLVMRKGEFTINGFVNTFLSDECWYLFNEIHGMVWFNHAFLWLKSRNNTKQQEEIQ